MSLKSQIENLEEVNQKDFLTQLLNRRTMLEILERENAPFQRTNQSFVIVFADLDKFKSINDSCGHACGDYVIVKTAQILTANLRSCDYVARWGGEEFLIMLTNTTLDSSQKYIERVREKLLQEKFIWQEKDLTVTVTFGVAIHNRNQTIAETIEQADSALYQGKLQGGNCIVVFNQ